MHRIARYLGQGVVYGLIAALLGYFAAAPAYRHAEADQAQLTVSLAHSAKRVSECRRRTAAEIAALPPNMRKPLDCPRGRLPVLVEVELDGRIVMRDSAMPSGLFGDGPSQVYRNFVISTGPHDLAVRLRDSDRVEGFDYEREARIEIAPRQRFVIEFRAETGGFRFATRVAPAAPPHGARI
jgi:hypothetical protein